YAAGNSTSRGQGLMRATAQSRGQRASASLRAAKAVASDIIPWPPSSHGQLKLWPVPLHSM
ncbi:hypothetical protein Dimus_007950, partial [Dionaea muscipula]